MADDDVPPPAVGAIMGVSGTTLTKINQAVGFRLVTKAGTTGLVNLTKVVPLIGGVVGGGFDAFVTSGIGSVAKEAFYPVGGDDGPVGGGDVGKVGDAGRNSVLLP